MGIPHARTLPNCEHNVWAGVRLQDVPGDREPEVENKLGCVAHESEQPIE
jgi:hypothetical protein